MAKMNVRPVEKSAEVFAASSSIQKARYAEGVRPFFDVLRDLKLPPRGKVGSRVNKKRQRIVLNALKKEARRQRKERAHGKAQ